MTSYRSRHVNVSEIEVGQMICLHANEGHAVVMRAEACYDGTRVSVEFDTVAPVLLPPDDVVIRLIDWA